MSFDFLLSSEINLCDMQMFAVGEMFQRKTSPALTVKDLYVQKKKKFSEQNTLPVIKEATRLVVFVQFHMQMRLLN